IADCYLRTCDQAADLESIYSAEGASLGPEAVVYYDVVLCKHSDGNFIAGFQIRSEILDFVLTGIADAHVYRDSIGTSMRNPFSNQGDRLNIVAYKTTLAVYANFE